MILSNYNAGASQTEAHLALRDKGTQSLRSRGDASPLFMARRRMAGSSTAKELVSEFQKFVPDMVMKGEGTFAHSSLDDYKMEVVVEEILLTFQHLPTLFIFQVTPSQDRHILKANTLFKKRLL